MNERDSSVCPHCGETIASGAALCRFCQRGIDPTQFSPCPLCREMVRSDAVVCRFCSNKIHLDNADPFELHTPVPPTKPETTSKDSASREGGMPKFNLPQIGKLFKPTKDNQPQSTQNQPYGAYGPGVRSQVFEVIVRQALAGAPWREICAGPMHVNNITPQEVEAEVNRRMALISENDENADLNLVEQHVLKCEKLINRLLRTADDITGTHSQLQRNILAEDIRELTKQLMNVLQQIKEQADNSELASVILQREVDRHDEKYDAILDLVNARDKIIEELQMKLSSYDEGSDGSSE